VKGYAQISPYRGLRMVELSGIGYGLIILGIVLFLAEALVPGFFIAVPATVLLIVGMFALFTPDPNTFGFWAPVVCLAVGVPATLATLWFYRRMAKPDEAPTTQTAENLVGIEGIVTKEVLPDSMRGKVKLGHQSWSATTRGAPIPTHAKVRVVAVDGVILIVKPTVE
jgi:membrane protein implicated in regulation of membrane protease activity